MSVVLATFRGQKTDARRVREEKSRERLLEKKS